MFSDVLVFSNTKGWGSMLFSRQLTYSVQIIDQEGITNIPTGTTEAALQQEARTTNGGGGGGQTSPADAAAAAAADAAADADSSIAESEATQL